MTTRESMKAIKQRTMVVHILVFLLFCAAPMIAQAADIPTAAAKPINLSIGVGGVRQVSDLPQYLGVLYRWFVGAAMVIAAFMITLGGFQYVASAGIPKYVGMAKQRIINGLMGLLLVIGSYVLLNSINPAFTQLKLPEIRKIQKIDLAAKSCEEYKTRQQCIDNPQQFKDDGGCVWIEAPSGKCARKSPQLGKSNGSPCRSTEPKCDAKLACVHTNYLNSEGDYCTNGEIGSPCVKGSKDAVGGCQIAKGYICGELLPRCEPATKKETGGQCTQNGECKSDICFKGACADKSNPPKLCTGEGDCTKYPGTYCCVSEKLCADPEDIGVCREVGTLGMDCKKPIECESHVCSMKSADIGACLGVEGETCQAGSECASGNCTLVEGSSTEKQCAKKASGQSPTP